MLTVPLFPFAEYQYFYAGFVGFVLLLLMLDLGVFHKKVHEVSIKESAIWSVIWVSLALLFNVGLYVYAQYRFGVSERLQAIAGFDATQAASQVALEFLTGFVIEKALAIDNIFVFVVMFNFLGIPKLYQHRVLFFGIIGALVFRALFIAIGSHLLSISWVVWVAGAFLIFTGIKILLAPDKESDPANNALIKFVKRYLPMTNTLHGQAFFIREGGKWLATPLFLALVFIEGSDIIFAIDSVPAIFAITKEPLIVFTSNIFAILGLRSLYFMLASVVDKFYLLKYGLGLVLVFVGLKMTWLNKQFDGHFPILWSLGIIGGILVASVVGSLVFPKKSSKAD